jgi:hypothetical protein
VDLGKYIGQRLPTVIRGLTNVVASRVAVQPEVEDPTPRFMARRLQILEKYQRELNEKANPPRPAVIQQPATHRQSANCPYCELEEMAGVLRNHLLFIAQECQDDELGPATGGMVPHAKEACVAFMSKADTITEPQHVALLAQLAKMKAQELMPKLEWIETCAEAREAATLADEVWHRAAKATQMYYAHGDQSPYA